MVEQLGKTAASAEDFPAFIVNRILMPMINEAVYTLYEGVGSVKSIDKSLKLGANHPMGPLELADFIGLDTCLAIMNVLHEGLADTKYRPCPLLTKYVEAGWLGRKTQRGFYDYRGEVPVPTRRPRSETLGAAAAFRQRSAVLQRQRMLPQPGQEAARVALPDFVTPRPGSARRSPGAVGLNRHALDLIQQQALPDVSATAGWRSGTGASSGRGSRSAGSSPRWIWTILWVKTFHSASTAGPHQPVGHRDLARPGTG